MCPTLAAPMLPSVNPSVIFQKLDDGAVLFAPETEMYFGLNAVGALVWEQLPPRHASLDALCESLTAMFPDIALDTVRADVEELLEQLITEGLLLRPDPRGTDAAAAS